MDNYQDAPAAICIPVLFDKVTDDTFLSACWKRRPKRRDNIHVGDVKYIKKDFLLEWAEKVKADASIGLSEYDMGHENGIVEAMNCLIEKLNNL